MKVLSALEKARRDSGFMAADTDILVFGVSKDIDAQTIITYAEKQDIHPVNCELLTKWDQARSLTFKLTIKSRDFEKASCPSTWPYRIGIRTFQRFKGNSSSREVQTPKAGNISILKKTKDNTQINETMSKQVRFPDVIIIRINIYETLSEIQESQITKV